MNALMAGISLVLLIYWFRQTVRLILQSAPGRQQVSVVVKANGLSLLEVQQRLYDEAQPRSLPLLYQMLRKDYRAIRYLLEHLEPTSGRSACWDQYLLRLNFRLASCWFAATYRYWPRRARTALAEMSATVEFFGGVMGQCLTTSR